MILSVHRRGLHRRHSRRSPLREALSLLLLCGLSLIRCAPSADSIESTLDMAQVGPCGRGELSLQLGRGRPLRPLSDPAPAMIEYGLQGDYHVDLSFAFQGSINPDLVSLRLLVSDDEGWQIGEHFTAGWYLLLEESEEERPTCYFYDARLFLYERDGSLPSEETVSRLAGREESLEIELEEQSGVVHSFARSLLFTLPEE